MRVIFIIFFGKKINVFKSGGICIFRRLRSLGSYKIILKLLQPDSASTQPPVVIMFYIKPAGLRMIRSWGKEITKHNFSLWKKAILYNIGSQHLNPQWNQNVNVQLKIIKYISISILQNCNENIHPVFSPYFAPADILCGMLYSR